MSWMAASCLSYTHDGLRLSSALLLKGCFKLGLTPIVLFFSFRIYQNSQQFGVHENVSNKEVLSQTHLQWYHAKARLCRPSATGADWGNSLDCSPRERNRNVFTLKSSSLLEVLFGENAYLTDCFTNICIWRWRLSFSTPQWKGVCCISSKW